MPEKTDKKKLRLKDLWMLLLEDPTTLDDNQITSLIEAKEELRELINRVWRGALNNLERVQNYRSRKKELSGLPTEKLMVMKQEITKGRGAYLASRDEEDIGDSFFEVPAIDSDERIIAEILKERKIIRK
jgi:hypothetical protein